MARLPCFFKHPKPQGLGTARQEAPFVTRTVTDVLAGDVIWRMVHGLWESWLGAWFPWMVALRGRG